MRPRQRCRAKRTTGHSHRRYIVKCILQRIRINFKPNRRSMRSRKLVHRNICTVCAVFMFLMVATGRFDDTFITAFVATWFTGGLDFRMTISAYAQHAACACACGYKQKAYGPGQNRCFRCFHNRVRMYPQTGFVSIIGLFYAPEARGFP